MIVVVSPDPADARRVERAVELLQREMRLNGYRLPSSLGPVVHAQAATNRQEPTPLPGGGADGDDRVVQLLWSLPDVARMLDSSERTVERLVASGDLPTVQLGRRVYVRPEDAVDFVRALPPRQAEEG